MEEHQIEIENRIRNLVWTVSGDYTLEAKPDVEAFGRNKYIALYDAIRQGAFAKYYDADALSLYLIKKLYFGAQETPLMGFARLAVEMAASPRVARERPGVEAIRKKAFAAMLEHDLHKMNQSFAGRVKIALLRDALNGRSRDEQRIQEAKERLYTLEQAEDTMQIIREIDRLYNTMVDPYFEKTHGSLKDVLALETRELARENWKDLLDEEACEAVMEQFLEQLNRQVTTLEETDTEAEERTGKARKIRLLDEKAVAKMHSYMELNFGRSYLSAAEQERQDRRLCTGAHADCSLYYTDGILEDPVLVNAQYVNAKKQADRNRLLLHNSQSIVRHNIDVMTAALRRSLLIRSETDQILSEFGAIVPNRLWRVGRSSDGKVFKRILKQNNSDFAVDVLIDASGSQRDRQSQVALQAYIISRALSNVGIPHRVCGFCTFWDYTVLQRYREYDAPAAADERILQYNTTANNRDGLAIRAAADSLARREEENKILIVLSDGRPNDVIVNRPNSRNPQIYCGEYAVRDTAKEVRRLRNEGLFVLGVFAGKERDLAAEKTVFGRDFAYIRDIRNFSAVVSRYLQKLLDW